MCVCVCMYPYKCIGSADSAEHLASGLVFGVFVWQVRSWRDAVPGIERGIPVYVAGLEGREGRPWLCYDLPSGGSRASLGGKRRLLRGGGSTARISNDVKPQDPGGGEEQLTFSRDVAGEWPVFHPTSRSVTVQPEDVEVTAMSADAARRQVDCALPTDSNRVSVVVEGLRQDSKYCWSRMGSHVPGKAGMWPCRWCVKFGRRTGHCTPNWF